MDKEFKTLDELIVILKNRNVTIDDEDKVKNVLDYENYYSVINGYKDLFLTTTATKEWYKTGTRFEEIFALYSFDRKIREFLLLDLLRIEKVLRSRMVYVFSKYHGHDHRQYLNLTSFNDTTPVNKTRAQNVIDKLNVLIISEKEKYGALKHYIETYGYVPLWVLVNVMTFGNLTSFYAVMKYQEKLEIAAMFNLDPGKMKSLIDFVAKFRNKCAHGERIYLHAKDFKLPKPIPYMPEHIKLSIPFDQKKGYKYGMNDVLALLIAMKPFMHPKRYKSLINHIDYAIANKLNGCLSTITTEQVCRVMGLQGNWQKLKCI